MKPNRLSHIRWGEALAFLTILIVGIVIFILQLLTWALPQLVLYQEFIPSWGVVLDKRINEYAVGSEIRYRPEVLLDHAVGDKTYRIWTFDYLTLKTEGGMMSQPELAQSALEPFIVGQQIRCWYRVNRPEQAIVKWEISIWGWFLLFLSFSLIILGCIGFPQSFRLLETSKERQAASLTLSQTFVPRSSNWSTIPDIPEINESPGTQLMYRLPLGQRSIFPLLGQTVFATAWTVIGVVILVQSVLSFSGSEPEQLSGIFFRGVFCGIGLIFYWVIAQQLWELFRVAPTLLELSDHPISPNRQYKILLYQNGALKFETLSVDLVCEEIARFHQGTDTVTHRQDVFRQTIFSRSNFCTLPDSPLREEFIFQLPEGAMHSFRGKNNEIAWKLEFNADLVGRSELHRDCPIIVRQGLLSDLTMEGNGL